MFHFYSFKYVYIIQTFILLGTMARPMRKQANQFTDSDAMEMVCFMITRVVNVCWKISIILLNQSIIIPQVCTEGSQKAVIVAVFFSKGLCKV